MTLMIMMSEDGAVEDAEHCPMPSDVTTRSAPAGAPSWDSWPLFRDERQQINLTKLKQALRTQEAEEAVELLLESRDDEQELCVVAEHEVAHAVMRKICGLRATTLVATSQGGFCEGSSEPAGNTQALLVMLAGYVWEALAEGRDGNDIDLVPFRENSDIKRAWELLDEYTWLRLREHEDGKVVVMPVEDAMKVWAERAGRLIWRYRRVIRSLGQELAAAGFLSARCLARRLRNIERDIMVRRFDLDFQRPLAT
ncbi:hypothetical protein [Luteolibacter soli]|uniref:Peptidase M48 domain-containing protein n=1 Tax=Luteolibacter soli TaxID=3135280 RepID=A0ABU9AZT0_9BACT